MRLRNTQYAQPFRISYYASPFPVDTIRRMLRLALAALHLLALGIGLGAVWGRARALAGPLDQGALRRAFAADAWWGLAAIVWITTGLWRALAGFEKEPSYYWTNHLFMGKMGMLALVLLLEIFPAITLVRWRMTMRRGAGGALVPGASPVARRIAGISYVQAILLVVMVAAAVGMARGYGAVR